MASSSLSRPPSAHQPPSRGGALFPVRLHKLLEEETRKGNTDIVSWSPDGQSFKVHDKIRFANEIMPTYFGTSKYRSFQKNLNLWQFKTVTSSASRYLPGRPPRAMGECYHPMFVRGYPVLMERMKRVVVKNPKLPSSEEGPTTVPTPLNSGDMLLASALSIKNGNVKKPAAAGDGTVEPPRSLGSLFTAGGSLAGLPGATRRSSLPNLNPLLAGGDYDVLSRLPVLSPIPGNDASAAAASLLRNSSLSSVGGGLANDNQKSADQGLSLTNDILRLLASTNGPAAAAAATALSTQILPPPATAPASFLRGSSLTTLPPTSVVPAAAPSLSATAAAAATSRQRSNDLVNLAAILLLSEAEAQANLSEQRRSLIQHGVLADLADTDATRRDFKIHEV